MDNSFCIQGNITQSCKEFVFYEFPTEKEIIVAVLEYFKSSLPKILKSKKDYYNKQIIIDPADIDLIVQKDYGDYVAVIAITDDNSTYPDENFLREHASYAFEVELQVRADDLLASLENLITFKSAVKTLLINMDSNLGVITHIQGFSYGSFGSLESSNKLIRQGLYRFSVRTDNQKL